MYLRPFPSLWLCSAVHSRTIKLCSKFGAAPAQPLLPGATCRAGGWSWQLQDPGGRRGAAGAAGSGRPQH